MQISWFSKCEMESFSFHCGIFLHFQSVLPAHKFNSLWPSDAATMKIISPQTVAGKTHGPVNLLYIPVIMSKIRKIKPNSGSVHQKPKSFHSECDAKWQHRTGLTLVQVMAYSLMAPSHYLNQCWFIIKGVLSHSPENIFAISAHELNLKNVFHSTFPREQWVKSMQARCSNTVIWLQ